MQIFTKQKLTALSYLVTLAKIFFLILLMKPTNQGTFEQRLRRALLLMFYGTYLREHKGTREILCQDGIEMHYCISICNILRIYRRFFFINWILANLILYYKRAFTSWICIMSKLYSAKYIALISLVGLIQLLKIVLY